MAHIGTMIEEFVPGVTSPSPSMLRQAPAVTPVPFDIPTLGRAVRLGELYDIRSAKFLGVQLYPQNKDKEVETYIADTELIASPSTTRQQRATLLGVDPRLSLDVLAGLVQVSGSASCLNDERPNTNEHAYALALKMRLREKRILFAEDELGPNVLYSAVKEYIHTKLATHFVSSIVYGGKYIVNLVARQSEEEKIERKLYASFDKLKGAIHLKGTMEAKKADFNDMDDKFDLIIHGDFALTRVPINPKDILDTFPEAASFIVDRGGVPISVTLQPIPSDLYKGGPLYRLEEKIVNTLIVTFSNLDDIRNRFLVLRDSAKRLRDFVPRLDVAIRNATDAYIEDFSELLHELARFLQDSRLGEHSDHHALLRKAGDLYKDQLKRDATDQRITNFYPSSIAGLEDELSRFRHLVSDIRRVRASLNPPRTVKRKKVGHVDDDVVNHSVYLSDIEDVCRAIRTQKETVLFIMTPISGDAKPDRLILEYLALVREYSGHFEDIINVAHMFYVEHLEDFEELRRRFVDDRLPSGEKLPELVGPSVIAARIDKEGKLTWDALPPARPPSSPLHAFRSIYTDNQGKVGSATLGIDGVVSRGPFSTDIRARQEESDWDI